ncbi:hypothetical protein, partial [Azotobacter vinelandii]|uniref:hypothetical protein n=1 Tax=Azotobacter vinelandii TaxID=354 RepID=UPI001E43483F
MYLDSIVPECLRLQLNQLPSSTSKGTVQGNTCDEAEASLLRIQKYDNSSMYSREIAEPNERIFLSGQQALVRLLISQAALDRSAGIRTAGFVSGYRGSPLG